MRYNYIRVLNWQMMCLRPFRQLKIDPVRQVKRRNWLTYQTVLAGGGTGIVIKIGSRQRCCLMELGNAADKANSRTLL